MSGAEAGIINVFWLVIQFDADCVDFDTLKEGLLGLLGGRIDARRIILEFEEARKEIEGVLINMEAKRQYVYLF